MNILALPLPQLGNALVKLYLFWIDQLCKHEMRNDYNNDFTMTKDLPETPIWWVHIRFLHRLRQALFCALPWSKRTSSWMHNCSREPNVVILGLQSCMLKLSILNLKETIVKNNKWDIINKLIGRVMCFSVIYRENFCRA